MSNRLLTQICISSLPPHKLFIKMARDGQWNLCEEFCKAFNIHYENCVEYAGDVFLKSKKTTQALLAYNKARVCIHEYYFFNVNFC